MAGALQLQGGDSGNGVGGAPADIVPYDIAPSAGALTGRPTVSAIRTKEPPRLDGNLDDPVWRAATKITNFVQERPVDGAPATEQTEVYVAYDSQTIYFGIYAHYSDPRLIRASRADRDQTYRDDTVTVFFDPFLDQQRGYSFSVNAYGVQSDSLMSSGQSGGGGGPGGGGPGGGPGGGGFRGGGSGGGGSGGGGSGGRGPGGGGPGGGRGGHQGDPSWNALFDSAGTLVKDGWTAEMAIPFKSLRYPARGRGQLHRWGFQIGRDIRSKDESVVWAPVSRDVMGFLPQMGVLDGMADLSTSRNLEILPTVTTIQTASLNQTTGGYGAAHAEEAGISAKYGISSNLTFDFAFNPDFSQIESDRQQIEVNQRFPLFYPELRPFFLEGQEIFSMPGQVTLVHTRTIVDPRYGAKLTGKVGKMTLGFALVNDEAPGKVEDRGDPAFQKTAQVVMGRLRYDLFSESHIGLIVTDREFLDSYSRVGGFDGQLHFGRNDRLGFRAVASSHRDSAGVNRSGEMIDAEYRKEGRNLYYGVSYFEISPDFRTDTGFVQRVDQRLTDVNLSYRWWPQSWVVNWGPRTHYSRNYDFAGILQDEGSGFGMSAQLARNIFLFANVDRDMERYNGINFRKTRYSSGGGVNTSRKVSFGGFGSYGDQIRYVTDPFLGTGTNLGLFTSLRPFSRLQSEIIVNTSRLVDPRTNAEAFDVKIFRSLTTYQFTERFLVRNIMEYNDFDRTLGGNFLVTYRVNSGTVFYVGYDARYKQGDRIDALLLPTTELRRTNRAIFAKLQVLFRY